MAESVSVEVGSLGKTSSAVVADKGFLAGVDSAVHLQIGGMAEGFVTMKTGKRLLLVIMVLVHFDFTAGTLRN